MAGQSEEAVSVGVLGLGYMGRNHARVLSALPEARLVGVYDLDISSTREVAAKYHTTAYENPSSLMEDVEAIVLAVPTDQHFDYARRALEAGLDVLVEKPITQSLDHAEELCSLSSSTGRVLQVGHIERFNPACLELPRLVNRPFYFSCERLSPYSPAWVGNTGVVIDLMIHDLDIVLNLVPFDIVEVNAVCADIKTDKGDLAVAQVRFANGTLANFVSSRVSQAKVRKISVTQLEEFVSVDLLRQTVAVHHFISSEYFFDQRLGFKQETVTEIPYLSRQGEPLVFELKSFIEVVNTREKPQVTGEDGMKALSLALRIAEACG